MCDLSKGLFLKGKAEGRVEGKTEGRAEGKVEGEKNKTLEIVKHLMKSQNWTALQALEATSTPQKEIHEYLALLEEKN